MKDYIPAWNKHAYLILGGILIVFAADYVPEQWITFYNVLIGIGSNLIAIAIVFLVFQLFMHKPQSLTVVDLDDDEELVPEDLRGSLSKYSSPSTTISPDRDYTEDGE